MNISHKKKDSRKRNTKEKCEECASTQSRMRENERNRQKKDYIKCQIDTKDVFFFIEIC